jgi:hypothetical protein
MLAFTVKRYMGIFPLGYTFMTDLRVGEDCFSSDIGVSHEGGERVGDMD